jgi:hypothetical protein
MNNQESRILSILRPGEMLRFVLRPDEERRIEFAIEGASANGQSDTLLSQRLGLVLGELRGLGYLFGKPMGRLTERSRKRHRRRSTSRSRAGWVEIRPRSVWTTPPHLGRLGFGQASEAQTATSKFCLPDLPPSVDSRLVRRRMQVDRLSGACAGLLGEFSADRTPTPPILNLR